MPQQVLEVFLKMLDRWSAHDIGGTMNLRKLDDGWKVIASHTSIAE
jgi:hypothetical protein